MGYTAVGYWNTRGLRGSTFEAMVDMTNEAYRAHHLALVQKVPTPIVPTKLDQKTRTITQAYFDKPSTVDFIGVAQGVPICFDAKETNRKSFPLTNIHPHQVSFMQAFARQKGIAFTLVRFAFCDETFALPIGKLTPHWEQARKGGKKSVAYQAFDRALLVSSKDGYLVHYLEAVNVMLERME